MSKIKNDKYYTPPDLANYCVEKTKEVIGTDNITEYIEPSAGAGVFLSYLDKPYLAYDIEPEDDRITRADWLGVNLEYKKGRCVIGNPPFGSRNTLAVRFYKQSVKLADYIAFILPISQLNNNQQMYEFDLIYSEDLKRREYSEREIHCCFNIYKRNSNGINKRPNYKLKDVFIKEFRSKQSSLSNKEQLISPSNSGLCDRENLFEVKQFEYEGKIICIAPLIFTLSTEDNVYYADNEELDIHACGESISALKESINDELSFIYSFYASKSDEELTYGACELKRKFLDMMKG